MPVKILLATADAMHTSYPSQLLEMCLIYVILLRIILEYDAVVIITGHICSRLTTHICAVIIDWHSGQLVKRCAHFVVTSEMVVPMSVGSGKLV